MIVRPALVASLAASLVAACAARADVPADRRALLAGVRSLSAPGAIPGALGAVGPRAFAFLAARSGRTSYPMGVAARPGRGRAVAVGHESFFGGKNLAAPDNARLARNVAAWAGGRPLAGLRVALVGQDDALAGLLRQDGAEVRALRPGDLAGALAQLDLVWMNQASLDRAPEANVRALRRWVEDGHGVVAAGPAWGWLQTRDADLARDHGANRLMAPWGVVFADGMLDGPYGVSDDAGLDALDAGAALSALERHATGAAPLAADALGRASALVAAALGALPDDDPNLAARASTLVARFGGDVAIDPAHPVTRAMPFARLKATLDARRLPRLAPEDVRAHPSAASFPGAVPATARRETRRLEFSALRPGWNGTGLYAPPGEVVTLRVPAAMVRKGVSVRVGAHTDRLWHLERWTRFPEVSLSRAIDAETVRVASAFGGAIYIEVPPGAALSQVWVSVSGAVAAPRFVHGVTPLAAWRETIRHAPGPWAELEGDHVILTVPSSVVRDLEDPDALMEFWDEMMRRCHELYAAPMRPRPERYCVDRQISAGYMHAGYPIMTGDDVARRFVDLSVLRGSDGNPCWGFYHEMGHNFQQPEWTWDGFGEVTNNLFSLYGTETLNGDQSGAHPAMKPAERLARIRAVAAAPGRERYYVKDPWYPLTMFHVLRAAFGWEPFTKVFAQLRDLPRAEKPASEQAKRDAFLVRFSRAVGKDIAGYLEAWGVELSDGAKKQVSDLPSWMPEGFRRPEGR